MKCIYKFCFIILVILFITQCNSNGGDSLNQENTWDTVRHRIDGLIQTDSTALKIAEAVWLQFFGKKIYKELPFRVSMKDSIWIVQGTSKYEQGGVVYIEIQAKDGKIITMYHTK